MARHSVTIAANGPKVNIENVLVCLSCAGGEGVYLCTVYPQHSNNRQLTKQCLSPSTHHEQQQRHGRPDAVGARALIHLVLRLEAGDEARGDAAKEGDGGDERAKLGQTRTI